MIGDDLPAVGSWHWAWAYGLRHGYEFDTYGRWGEWPVNKLRRQWLPMWAVFNVTDYRTGNFRMFLADRRQKAEYQLWTPMFFAAEDYYHALNQ